MNERACPSEDANGEDTICLPRTHMYNETLKDCYYPEGDADNVTYVIYETTPEESLDYTGDLNPFQFNEDGSVKTKTVSTTLNEAVMYLATYRVCVFFYPRL